FGDECGEVDHGVSLGSVWDLRSSPESRRPHVGVNPKRLGWWRAEYSRWERATAICVELPRERCPPVRRLVQRPFAGILRTSLRGLGLTPANREPERHSRGDEKNRSVAWSRELGTDAGVPVEIRAKPVSYARLDPGGIRLP